jgi:hypothetical protein
MNWTDFEDDLMNKHIHTINNNSSKNIVLFGSCHMATIGYMLNKLLKDTYNIHIIISWFFENKGVENFDMNTITQRINDLVSNCDIFIYHNHINSYHVNADKLPSFVKENCLTLMVPNYRLDYTSDSFDRSLQLLEYTILFSNFPEFIFIIENHKDIMFFNTTNHPTHYLLFLQSQSIQNKIMNNDPSTTLSNYFDEKNRIYFKQFTYVTLPGKEVITSEMSNKTGIQMNADYFDF